MQSLGVCAAAKSLPRPPGPGITNWFKFEWIVKMFHPTTTGHRATKNAVKRRMEFTQHQSIKQRLRIMYVFYIWLVFISFYKQRIAASTQMEVPPVSCLVDTFKSASSCVKVRFIWALRCHVKSSQKVLAASTSCNAKTPSKKTRLINTYLRAVGDSITRGSNEAETSGGYRGFLDLLLRSAIYLEDIQTYVPPKV